MPLVFYKLLVQCKEINQRINGYYSTSISEVLVYESSKKSFFLKNWGATSWKGVIQVRLHISDYTILETTGILF